MDRFKISSTQIVQYIKFISHESPIIAPEVKQSKLFKEEIENLIDSNKNPNPFKKAELIEESTFEQFETPDNRRNTQWLKGIEDILGGGYINIGT